MLADIHTESLAELLTQVHSGQAAPNGPHILGSSFGRGGILEIQGGPSSGRTHLLFHLIIDCIIPFQYAGWADVAIVFDMDHSFDIIRLNHLLLRRLARSTGLNTSATEFVAQQSLQRLHVFRPASTLQLAATLSHLTAYHSSRAPKEKIGIVAIDSLSSRYWPDRFVAEQMRNSLWSHMQPGLNRTHRSLVIMTNWALHSPHNNSVPSLYRHRLQPFSIPSPCLKQPDRSAETNVHYPSSEDMPSLTYHITVQSIDTDARCSSAETQGGPVQFVVSLRKPNSSSVDKFILTIDDEDTSLG